MKKIKIGNFIIGSGERIAIQSMTTTPTHDYLKTAEQINTLSKAGCDIVRLAVPDIESANAISKIKELTQVPLVADIHFDYRIALKCIESGIDKVRINPGNLGGEERAKVVALAAKKAEIPIRIGVNSGSLEKGIIEKCENDVSRAMVESAKAHIDILRKYDFEDIVVSLKSSDVRTTIRAYRMSAEQFDYPLHIGVTESGLYEDGLVKSAIGIGSLLADGIGDTIRVSLTDDPILEVRAANLILKSLGIGRNGVEVISCPTCARCKIDLITIAKAIKEAVKDLNINIKVAVMGCVVNGPGEARDADIGIAGGDGCALLFKKGKVIKKLREENIVDTFIDEIKRYKE